ncbi:MAG TPA: hypothetical protein PLZ68_08465 [Ferruginibacter sp.]|nr:hypothetical protein [Ferruginibacter sp.]
MRKLFIVASIASLFLFSCDADKAPDVSHIKIDLVTERFDKKLFDTTTTSLTSYLQQLQSTDPAFTNIFIYQVLGADPKWPADTTAAYVNLFVNSYRSVYADAQKIFNDFSTYEKDIEKTMQYVKYYFPKYKVPGKIVTYIGPADGEGDGIGDSAVIVGLHYHLGKDNPVYKTALVQAIYPEYISRTFEPDHIPVNIAKQALNDIYPETESDKTLVNQMVAKGKRLYILKKFLPGTADYRLIGYTEQQMKDCDKNESRIWDMFVKANLLQAIDKNILKRYIEEGPKTDELGEGAPGNIGSYTGWQIVKKYMEKKPETTAEQLIKLDEEMIFQEAKYKP